MRNQGCHGAERRQSEKEGGLLSVATQRLAVGEAAWERGVPITKVLTDKKIIPQRAGGKANIKYGFRAPSPEVERVPRRQWLKLNRPSVLFGRYAH